MEGFSYKEIADITDVPIGTVMSRIHRGRRALQKALYGTAAARGLSGQHNRKDGLNEEVRAWLTTRSDHRWCGSGSQRLVRHDGELR